MTKIIRKQQEILIVNGKTVSVEGGAVVNSYDLTDQEFLDVIFDMEINALHIMIEAAILEKKLNKKK